MNKFLLKENTFEENYAGVKAGIVDIHNIRRLHIQGDTYTKNGAQYSEALNKYGTIKSEGSIVNNLGAYKLEAYHLKETDTSSLAYYLASKNIVNYFPVAPLVIEGSVFLHAEGLTFDGNAFLETLPKPTENSRYRPAQCITIRNSFGQVHFKTLGINNVKGMDINQVHEITGDTK